MASYTYKTIVVEKNHKTFRITFNRPSKMNAMSTEMSREIVRALNEASASETLLTVFTGKGDYFCSGADVFDRFARNTSTHEDVEERGTNKFINAFLDHPKPLIALVNGPAIGIAMTMLGLFDLVYASDKATFNAPFTTFGIVPEGCSTITFPQMMGHNKAAEMLMFGRKITAEEACRRGLVTEVFPSATFVTETDKRIKQFSQLPPGSVLQSKKLMRDVNREQLRTANRAETEMVVERRKTEEFANAVKKFMIAKSKI